MICHLDKIGGRAWENIPSQIGTRLPATETVAGRVLFAYLLPEEVDKLLELHEEAGIAPVDRIALEADLLSARRKQGVLLRAGESRVSGISTAAAPVLGPHGPVAAISLAWRRDQTSPGRAARLVLLAARKVSVELFPGWGRAGARTP